VQDVLLLRAARDFTSCKTSCVSYILYAASWWQRVAVAGAQVIPLTLRVNEVARPEAFGAAHAINSTVNDPVEAIRELTGGQGTCDA
jgi:hypothetical protein